MTYEFKVTVETPDENDESRESVKARVESALASDGIDAKVE